MACQFCFLVKPEKKVRGNGGSKERLWEEVDANEYPVFPGRLLRASDC